VVPEAPWVLNPEFLTKFQIDYVAHDEDPYSAVGHDDVYTFVKNQGDLFFLSCKYVIALVIFPIRKILAYSPHPWHLHIGAARADHIRLPQSPIR
jgi:hypothetical protein